VTSGGGGRGADEPEACLLTLPLPLGIPRGQTPPKPNPHPNPNQASLMGSLLKCLPGSQLQRPALELLPASLRPQRQRVWLTEVTGARRTFTIDLRAGHPYLPTSPHISLYLP